MDIPLTLRDREIRGEFALLVPPGTLAAARDKLVDEHLTEALFALARSVGAVLATDAHDYARPQDGRDDQGRTRFVVRARIEGDRLLPVRAGARRRR